MTDIEPDSKVRAAMNEINAAQRMRMAAREKAEAEKVMLVTRAEGEPATQLLSSMHSPRHISSALGTLTICDCLCHPVLN